MKICLQRHSSPDRTEARDSMDNWLATLTDGAYTVALAGPIRTFAEPTAAQSVTHAIWVLTLPAPFDSNVDATWLTHALKANEQAVPDVLAIAMQYIVGSPAIFEDTLQIAGDASYGPLKEGKPEEGSDFNDYLFKLAAYLEQVPGQRATDLHRGPLPGLFSAGST